MISKKFPILFMPMILKEKGCVNLPSRSHGIPQYKCTGPVYGDISGLPPLMFVCIVRQDIFLNHVPAGAHIAEVAT